MYGLGFFSFNIIGLSSPLLPCRLVDLRRGLCHRTLFLLVFFGPFFDPTSLPFLTPPFSPYDFHAYDQTTRTHSIGITGHQTTRLLGYQHSKTVLLWFLLNPILCWSFLCHHRMLPPLKVLDFLDMEHE